ncbi:hypothetical protein ACIRD3_37525 [Kitasatospora sp. NPDC093550]|uniref:hypothetical protein n=1 Tax=Kitasatospora sp. NPDC093550 TaxID=3364089 RepID=UPI0037F2710B
MVLRKGPGTVRRPLAAALVVGIALTMSACSGKDHEPAAPASPSVPATPSPSAATSTAGPAGKDTADVLAAYQAYTEAKITAMTTGQADPDKLLRVATGSAYDGLAGDITRAQQAGILYKGTEVTHPQVTAVNLSDSPHKATLTDCVDVSNWTAVFSASGKNAAATGTPGRLYVDVEAVQAAGGAWLISAYSPDRSRTC